MLQYSFVNEWNEQYAHHQQYPHPWSDDAASGHLLVEGHYLPVQAEPPLIGTISIEMKDIEVKILDKTTGQAKTFGKGTFDEDWTALCLSRSILVEVGSQLRVGNAFDIEITKIAKVPKLVNNGSKFVKGELQFVILGAPYLHTPPTVDMPAATIAKVTRPCIIPGIPKDTPLDNMIKERYLTGIVSTWDNTTARKALLDLEPRGSINGQRLLKDKPTVSTRGMNYEDTNRTYADAHTAGTLSNADYVEWIVSVRSHSTAFMSTEIA